MPFVEARLLWSRGGLGGPVLVGWGRIVSRFFDLVAAAGQNLYVFTQSDGDYAEFAVVDVGETVLSLAVGLPAGEGENIVIGTENRILVYGNQNGLLALLSEVAEDPGAGYVDLVLADLDGDGREEVVAAAENRNAVTIYRTTEALQLEFLALRLLPGPAQQVSVLFGTGAPAPLVAVAYGQGDGSGILTIYFTETGFQEGPYVEGLPVRVTAMTAGDLTAAPGEELAWAGSDGRVRVMEAGVDLVTVLTTDVLGNLIPALTAGIVAGGRENTLIAGTSEGYLFGFPAPVGSPSPDWAVAVGSPVRSIAAGNGTRTAVGTGDEAAQVWRLLVRGAVVHVVGEGESLFTIARYYGTTAEALAAANNISGPYLIYPGQELVIP